MPFVMTSSRTIRQNLLWIVFLALLPTVAVSIWQGAISLKDSRDLVANRLRANTWSVAETKRTPFIIAQHALTFASQQPDIRDFGPQCSDMLGDALHGARGIVNFVRTDADGRARCSALPFTAGQDVSGASWWQEALHKRGLVLTRPQIGVISHRPVIIMVLPQWTASGSFDGTISAGISLEMLQSSLLRKAVKGSGALMVVNAQGIPVIQTGPVSFDRLADVAKAQTVPLPATASDDSPWIFVAAPLYRDELFVVYAEPRRAVLAAAIAQIRFSLLLPLLAIALTSIAVWLGTQRLLVHWLQKLHTLTSRFARGDFAGEREAYLSAPVEISQLAADLHEMARAIGTHERNLNNALAAKTALTREVQHRVKNNLQIVISLLTLQADRTPNQWAREVLNQAKSRITALGLIHRLLYERERDNEQGSVHMVELLGELCAQLRSENFQRPEIALHYTSADVRIPVDTAVPVTLLIVEAVSNAFRHAYPNGAAGEVHVSLEADGQEARLSIADHGQGFTTKTAQNKMGLDLMEALAGQMKGRLAIESAASGTTVRISFPLEED